MLIRMMAVSLVLFSFAGAAAEEVKVTVTRTDCARLVRHQPSADVAYKPGVDAKGRPVAPADLPGSGADMKVLPEVLEFSIAVNPVGWGERVNAQKAKAEAEKNLATTIKDRLTAENTLAILQAEQAKLATAGTTLFTDLATLQNELTTLQTDLATMEANISAGTMARYDPAYRAQRNAVSAKQTEVTTKQAEVTANTASQTANANAQTAQQAIIDAEPDKVDSFTADKRSAESSLSSLSARGLDESSTKVGTVTYDIAKGTFLFNGQPLGSAEMRDLAEACAKMGVR